VSTRDPHRGAAADKADNGSLLGTLERLQSQRPHLQILISLLVLAFIVTSVLAYQALDAGRAQRQTVERSLRDYSEIAVSGWKASIESLAFDLLRSSFRAPEQLLHQGAPPETVVAAIAFNEHCACDTSLILTDFWLDFTVPAAMGRVDEQVVSLVELRAELAGDTTAPRFMPDARFGIKPVAGEADLVLIYFIRDSDQDVPLQAYGLVARVAVLEALLAKTAALDFLPPSRQRGMASESIFELRARVRSTEVFRTVHEYPDTYTTLAVTGNALSGLQLQAVVNPGAVDELIIGGLPANRLPLLLALLAITGALTTTAVFLLRRESELTRLRSEFVASVSHELRTPLAQIRMFAETLMLGRTRNEAERRKSLEIIDQEARRLAHLVENVLLYAKSERRRTVVAPRPTPLVQEVVQAVESFRPFCRSRNSSIRCELESDIIVNVDRFALRQVLLNLFDNALKYGPMGQEITVGLAVFDGSVRIWVDDEGPGIPSAQWGRVFEAFYRGSGDMERSVAGSGIGLAVVKELATLHGGRAWAEDAPGGGARITIELPNAHVAPCPNPHIGAVA
jgi:signal transduction histidine kinase